MKITSRLLVATLSLCAPLTLQAQALPNAGNALPALLGGLGPIADPLLQPILGGITGPLAADAIPQLVPPLSNLLGGLLSGPLNGVGNVQLIALPAIGQRDSQPLPGGLLGLPGLPGLD